jgi:DNA-binding transcriptional ArsR family regulator
MDLSSGDISSMIFRRTAAKNLGNFSLNRQTLNVYMGLNGKATLGEVAENSGINMSTMRQLISTLLDLGLIERVQKDVVMLDGDFYRYLISQLSLATGPIASVLIEDEVHDLGYEVDRFPGYRAIELIDRLAAQIRREDKKSIFIKNLANKILQKGYNVH